MKKSIYILLSFFIISIVALLYSNFVIAIIGYIGLLLTILALKKIDGNNNLYLLMSIVFLIQVIFAIILHNGYIQKYGVPYYLGGSDDLAYENWAIDSINNHEIFPWQITSYDRAKGFIWIITIILRISNIFGGYNNLSLALLNFSFLNIISILIYRFIYDNYDVSKINPIYIYVFISLYPNNIYVSAHGFRDTLSALCIVLLFYLFNNRNKIYTKIISIILISYFAYLVRPQNVYYIIIILVTRYFWSKRFKSIKTYLGLVFFVLLFIIVLLKFNLLGTLLGYIDRYKIYNTSNATGLSKYVFTIPLFPFGMVLRIIYGFVYPIPIALLSFFNIFNDIDVLCNFYIAIGTTIHILFLPYLIKGLLCFDRLSILYISIFFSIIISTFGFRHFVMLTPLEAAIVYLEYSKASSNHKWSIFLIMLFLIGFIGCFYLLLIK